MRGAHGIIRRPRLPHSSRAHHVPRSFPQTRQLARIACNPDGDARARGIPGTGVTPPAQRCAHDLLLGRIRRCCAGPRQQAAAFGGSALAGLSLLQPDRTCAGVAWQPCRAGSAAAVRADTDRHRVNGGARRRRPYGGTTAGAPGFLLIPFAILKQPHAHAAMRPFVAPLLDAIER
jgi:hypothetical protein